MYEFLDAKGYLGTYGGWTIPTIVKLKMTAKLLIKKKKNTQQIYTPYTNNKLTIQLKSFLFLHTCKLGAWNPIKDTVKVSLSSLT